MPQNITVIIVTIETIKCGNSNETPSQISSIEIGFPHFYIEEISFQILEFIDRETNVRRNYSMVLRGTKTFPSSFWPYFCRYRDESVVDRAMKRRK